MAVRRVPAVLQAVCTECASTLAYDAGDVEAPESGDDTYRVITCSECGTKVGVPIPLTPRSKAPK